MRRILVALAVVSFTGAQVVADLFCDDYIVPYVDEDGYAGLLAPCVDDDDNAVYVDDDGYIIETHMVDATNMQRSTSRSASASTQGSSASRAWMDTGTEREGQGDTRLTPMSMQRSSSGTPSARSWSPSQRRAWLTPSKRLLT